MKDSPWIVRVLPVAVREVDGSHRVEMQRGVQTFRVGPDYFDTKEEASAFSDMLRSALGHDRPERGAAVWVRRGVLGKTRRSGVVERVDGGYIYVRLKNGSIAELYDCELEVA